MRKIIIVTLSTLLAASAFAAEAPKAKDESASPANLQALRAAANKKYYDKAAAEQGTVKTPSGLLYQSIREGTGASPKLFSKVKVHYRGLLTNNKEFKNTYKTNKPPTHHLNRTMPCWSEGLLKMKAGGKARLVCPPELAFGSDGIRNLVPPDAIVIYEIELLEVK